MRGDSTTVSRFAQRRGAWRDPRGKQRRAWGVGGGQAHRFPSRFSGGERDGMSAGTWRGTLPRPRCPTVSTLGPSRWKPALISKESRCRWALCIMHPHPAILIAHSSDLVSLRRPPAMPPAERTLPRCRCCPDGCSKRTGSRAAVVHFHSYSCVGWPRPGLRVQPSTPGAPVGGVSSGGSTSERPRSGGSKGLREKIKNKNGRVGSDRGPRVVTMGWGARGTGVARDLPAPPRPLAMRVRQR